jgi:hypothetical protein
VPFVRDTGAFCPARLEEILTRVASRMPPRQDKRLVSFLVVRQCPGPVPSRIALCCFGDSLQGSRGICVQAESSWP